MREQATIPIVAATARVTLVHYAEIVASIASRSAGPGTRANIDECTETTSHAIEKVGGATRGKAIIVLNPAEPPMIMRDTVTLLAEATDKQHLLDSINGMVTDVPAYVPGYRLKQEVQVQELPQGDRRRNLITSGARSTACGTSRCSWRSRARPTISRRTTENLDIMTSAALRVGETLATGPAMPGATS